MLCFADAKVRREGEKRTLGLCVTKLPSFRHLFVLRAVEKLSGLEEDGYDVSACFFFSLSECRWKEKRKLASFESSLLDVVVVSYVKEAKMGERGKKVACSLGKKNSFVVWVPQLGGSFSGHPTNNIPHGTL